MKTVLIVLFLPVIAVAGSIEDIQHMELPIKGVRSMHIKSGSGYLDIFGVETSDSIKVRAAVRVSGLAPDRLQDFLDRHVLLSLEKRHRMAVLKSELINPQIMKADARIDLTVEIPRSLDLKIDDGTGSVFVTGMVKNLKVEDGSGLIEIRMTTGNVTVSDGSGEIELTDISGNIEVKDGSGSIRIDRVRGNVRVIDSSGSMSITAIDGNLTISDGSGSIEINDVSQNVYIKDAGSGTLDIDGVRGKVIMKGESDLIQNAIFEDEEDDE